MGEFIGNGLKEGFYSDSLIPMIKKKSRSWKFVQIFVTAGLKILVNYDLFRLIKETMIIQVFINQNRIFNILWRMPIPQNSLWPCRIFHFFIYFWNRLWKSLYMRRKVESLSYLQGDTILVEMMQTIQNVIYFNETIFQLNIPFMRKVVTYVTKV